MRYGKNAVGTGELEHTRRYGELLNTAVGQKDLEDYATSDLRTLASLARALAARAEQGIASRKPSFPSSLPPQLVLSWLPLRAAVSALRVSSAWRGAAEPLNRIIALRLGLTRPRTDIHWRDVVRTLPSWARSLGPFELVWAVPQGPRTVTNRYNDQNVHFLGRAVRVAPNSVASFRIKMDRNGIHQDACGFAILSTTGEIQTAYQWVNYTDEAYTFDHPSLAGKVETFHVESEEHPDARLWGQGDELSISVWNKAPRIHALLEHVDRVDRTVHERGTWYVTVQEENEIDVARSCPALAGFQDIIVAPIVRLYSGSAATLIRPPKDPVRPRDSWRPAVGESASALCYNRGPWGSRHRRTRESPDTDFLLGDFYLD